MVNAIARFEEELFAYFDKEHKDLLTEITGPAGFTDELAGKIDKAVANFMEQVWKERKPA